MPRRRGEYTLAKSTSFTIFPIVNASDKAFYSTKNTDKKLCKAKKLTQQKEKIKTGSSRESLQFFPRDFSKDYTISHEYKPNGNKRQLRTTSHDSSFHNSLKYSFEKMKLRATSQKYAKHEKMKSSGQMDMMPNMLMAIERNGSSGKNSWRKPRKIHRSKSGAAKLKSIRDNFFN
ncbi:unnamed protein product [Wuchereria bancrofti]|uniref:Uncharacterized protein n=1 Tax=Wuchereria bancrofti TaxID=6293 RepID=A0A3P7DXX2_WUCBA|nr:unnamed protein product [Wuchereria bancrofti]